MDCSTPGFPVHHHHPELAQSHVHWVSNAIHLSHPLSSPSPPALNLSQHQGLFQWISSSHQVVKVLEFQLQHQSFQWILRTDFLWIDWSDLLAFQGTLKSLLQHHSLKASILRLSAFFRVQLSHPYMTTGKQYTELYKKDLHDPDNHNGVITHLEPDILDCEVKWALGSITMNKVSGGVGIPVELFQILKDDVKVM